MIEIELERLLKDAKADPDLKIALLKTRASNNPVEDFCAFCRSKGYDINAGMTASDAKLRSVNGGGVNAIDGWDDAYEQFFSTLIWTN